MNNIIILANDVIQLKAQIENLPELKCKYTIVNESRIGNKVDEMKRLAEDLNIPAEIVDGQIIVDKFKKEVIDNNFVDSYHMGLNLLLPWYYKEGLFTEEDVILSEGIEDVFNLPNSAFVTSTLSYNSSNVVRPELEKIFMPFSDEEWKYTHTMSGQRLYKDFDFDLYEKRLYDFYNSEFLRDFWSKKRSHRSSFLDERFESCFLYESGILNNDLSKYTQIEVSRPERVDFSKYKIKKPLWHNATSSHKLKWLKALREHNIIKGD